MSDQQDTLEARVVAALQRADADHDGLIAALLSQCLALIRQRRHAAASDQPLGARRL
ncbi:MULTISPECIES: hypothetical protein [Sphingomonas]|uniref:Uncharacterized protein n=1 Tax=Sphingomonas kyungheensis TaxID=1069987 RepID=A0ABU8H363_9SPHN|nr:MULTISPECIES: hypothetical protein [unclassified Sphingomonas]EZP52847.1 hypothetical protein BW41_02211 [Sphingomonas sp. RIT328]